MTIGIYTITSRETGKTYVGQSISIETRWQQHIRRLRNNTHVNARLQNTYNKYGICNLQFRIIEECTKDELTEREIFWYEELQPEINILYPEAALSTVTSMPVCKCDPTSGAILEEYASIRDAARENNCAMSALWNAVHKDKATSLGYVWVFKNGYDPDDFSPIVARRQYARARAISQIDPKTGDVVAEFEHVQDAAETVGVSRSAILKSMQKRGTSGGFVWVYTNGINPAEDYRTPIGPSKAVMTVDNGIVRTFNSASEAARIYGLQATNIAACARGVLKSAGGLIWTYVQDQSIPYSHYVGVSYETRRGRWRARVTRMGKTVHLGYFTTDLEAAKVVDAWKAEHDDFTSRVNMETA